jgi:MOSC domain-containing protein YiiM
VLGGRVGQDKVVAGLLHQLGPPEQHVGAVEVEVALQQQGADDAGVVPLPVQAAATLEIALSWGVMPDSVEDYERRWQQISARAATGTVRAIVLRKGKGAHETPSQGQLSPEGGLHGDRWSADSDRDPGEQITIMDSRVIEVLAGDDPSGLHVPGDNLVLDLDTSHAALPVGARLRIGSALLEITDNLHAGCSKFRARLGDDALRWVNSHAHRDRRLRGVYARVVEAGSVALGDRAVRDPDAPAARTGTG